MKTVSSSFLIPITTSKTVSSLVPMPMPCNSMRKSTMKGPVTLTTTVNKAEWLGEPTSTGTLLGKLKPNGGSTVGVQNLPFPCGLCVLVQEKTKPGASIFNETLPKTARWPTGHRSHLALISNAFRWPGKFPVWS